MKEIKLLKILEDLFQRGYRHGYSRGKSEDGESFAVADALVALKKLNEYREQKSRLSSVMRQKEKKVPFKL